jgi:hypothetical protein
MRFAKLILPVVLTVALAAYALDCVGMTSAEQAMQCCKSMHCSHHGKSQDCCKTMPETHRPFVQAPAAHQFTFAALGLAVLPVIHPSPNADSVARFLRANSHAPPDSPPPASPPLRI